MAGNWGLQKEKTWFIRREKRKEKGITICFILSIVLKCPISFSYKWRYFFFLGIHVFLLIFFLTHHDNYILKIQKRKKRAEKNRKDGVKRLKLHTVTVPKPVVYCRHYVKGRCHEVV